MLSDSLFEAAEEIWDAVQRYDYAREFKDELIEMLTDMRFLQYKLDTPNFDHKLTREDIRLIVLQTWDERRAEYKTED